MNMIVSISGDMLLVLILLCAISNVLSSHFRGGIIMTRPEPGGSDYEVEISYHISWRRSYRFGSVSHFCDSGIVDGGNLLSGQGNLECEYGCSGRITAMSYVCTDFSTEEDWSFGEHRFTYDFATVNGDIVTIGFTGNAWIAPFSGRWNISTTFSLVRRNDTGRINSSPRAITAPVIRVQEGCNHTIAVAVTDPDGDIIRCRWAEGNECRSICNQLPGAELDPATCIISYQANMGARYWAAALMIEDFTPGSEHPLSSVALQFLVLSVESSEPCSRAPDFVQPTIRQGSCVAIPPNTTFTTQLIANSGGSRVSIAEIQTVSPLGTRRGDLEHVNDTSIYYLNITWAPSASQLNETHLFCFTAVNSEGIASEQNCIQLIAGYFPPVPLQATARPNQELVHPLNTTWSIEFNSAIERPAIVSYITFRELYSKEEVYRIDTSVSNEVIFEQSSRLLITPAHRFAEKQKFFISFDRGIVQGLQACGPGNEPVKDENYWTFDTMDVTPPAIVFLEIPSVSSGNISLSWESNENVTWECKIVKDNTHSTVDCSRARWKGYNLGEGMYSLEVMATDVSRNTATETHHFEVDLTPPITSILQKPLPLSNQPITTLTFACNEACSYECLLNTSSQENGFPCSGGFFTASMLSHNTEYTFVVMATDEAGNRGEPVSYTWETDFENPVISGVNNSSVVCSQTDPENTGFARAVDDRSEMVSVTYSDTNLGCLIKRTWTAVDEAGNVGHLVQNLELEFFPTVSLSPQVTLPCDSASSSIQVSTSTASAPNPCLLPLQLTYVDSASEYSCPGDFVRNWTVFSCERSASSSQSIILYNLCPPHACGRNESAPRGICSLGECRCNSPWYGDECNNLIYSPAAEPVRDVTLKEGQTYNATVYLTQGTTPISWTLLSGPAQLRVNQYTGQVTWSRAQAGNYTVTVQIENQAGRTVTSWNLQVNPGYTPFLFPVSPTVYALTRPVTLSGYLQYTEGSLFLPGAVPVLVNIDIRDSYGATRTLSALTNSSGFFIETFYPAATEYGTYVARARHPSLSLIEATPQTGWIILGFESTSRIIVLEGEAVNEFEKTFYNVTTIYNNGPGTLSDLTATPILANTQDVAIEVLLRGASTGVTLRPGDRALMAIKVSASRPLSRLFPVRLESAEGTTLQIIVNLFIAQILPSFSISPPSVSTRVIRGRSRIIEFRVTNVGSAAAHTVRSVLPATDLISFISFGSPLLSEGGLDLETGESAVLSLLAQIPETQPLGEISASIAVTSREISSVVALKLLVSSDLLTNLTVIVEDEYTYFADGQPLVNNAAVTLISYQRGIRVTQTTEKGSGMTIFSNIYEDRYELFVEAPDHRALQQVLVVSLENPEVTVFLEREAVKFTWSVTPIAFQDTYLLTIEADFKTHVPIPVVTVTPAEINLDDLELGVITSFQLNITNHGLIRANDVGIQLPDNHPFLQFTTDREQLGDLEPLSSFIISVRTSTKYIQKRSSGGCTSYPATVRYSFVCGELQIRSAPVTFVRTITNGNCAYSFVGGRGSGSGFFSGYATSTSLPCSTKCLRTVLLNCATLLLPPVIGCIPLILTDDPNESKGVVDALSLIQCASGSRFLGLGLCAYSVFQDCLPPRNRRKRDLESSVIELVEAMYPIYQSIDLGIEILGDELWIEVEDPRWLTNILLPALDDESEAGVLISNTELNAITTVAPPNGTTLEIVTQMVERLNNTLYGWNHGQLEPQDGFNMASFSTVQKLRESIRTYDEIARDKGFLSYLDAYNFASSDIRNSELEEEAGVCAIVRIRIEQELALTREAFLAKLEIENQDNSPIERIEIEILITDTDTGKEATYLFSIGNGTLSGSLRVSNGGFLLPGEMSGAVEWLIVPYSEAAPESDQTYDVGGTLRYIFEGENVTVPLLPSLITVRPDPSLLVHYFWERYVIGDDPFTDEVEQSVPFTLGVAVKNAGHGTAYSLQIASGQPEIIENEKGLLVNFMIIGANVNGGKISPSLSVVLGDLAPNTTVVARWLMVSSLQGEFMNYSATFENINPLGDPQLSIFDELEIHELIRNVMIYSDSEEEDGILDFLINERRDFLAYPDALYSSKTLHRYNVSAGTILSVRTSSDMGTSIEVRAFSDSAGWVYFRYEDTQGLLSDPAAGVNGTKWVLNETVSMPPENSWITRDRNSVRGTETLYLHILDRVQTTGEVVFMMSVCEFDCPTVEIPFVKPTADVATTQPPVSTTQSVNPTASAAVTRTGTTTSNGTAMIKVSISIIVLTFFVMFVLK